MGCVAKEILPLQPHPHPRPPLEGEGENIALNSDRDVIKSQGLRRGDGYLFGAMCFYEYKRSVIPPLLPPTKLPALTLPRSIVVLRLR